MNNKLYGAAISPFVRKVRMALAVKRIDCELIPVIPQGGGQPPEFKEHSPLGKIPLAYIDDCWLPDSTAILGYLERSRPDTALLDPDAKLAGKAFWFEQYASTHMAPIVGGHYFAELVLAPKFFKREGNQDEIKLAETQEIPAIFDYLESQFKGDYLLGSYLGHADICVGAKLFTLQHCDYTCDASRWPKSAAYIDRLLENRWFSELLADEKSFLEAVG